MICYGFRVIRVFCVSLHEYLCACCVGPRERESRSCILSSSRFLRGCRVRYLLGAAPAAGRSRKTGSLYVW